MTVVSNTTPLNYLILIGAVEVLPGLFQRVLTPEAVVGELLDPRAPNLVCNRAANPPAWLAILPVNLPPDPSLDELHAGEREAIMLSEQVAADLLLVDERHAWRVAGQRGLTTMGTLGVLETAAERGLLDFGDALARLRQTAFHVSEAVLAPFPGARSRARFELTRAASRIG